MDILLHITGLAFIPIMVFILFLGVRDIISVLGERNDVKWKRTNLNNNSNSPYQIYQITT